MYAQKDICAWTQKTLKKRSKENEHRLKDIRCPYPEKEKELCNDTENGKK